MRAPRSQAEYEERLARLLADLLVADWYADAGIAQPDPEHEPELDRRDEEPPQPRRRANGRTP
jgi:hypothetical protein